MTGESVSLYWTISWRIFAPLIMIGLFSSSIVKSFRILPIYFAYDKKTVGFLFFICFNFPRH